MAPIARDKLANMRLRVTFDRQVDGRWIALVEAVPGVMVYGRTRAEARRAVMVLPESVLEAASA